MRPAAIAVIVLGLATATLAQNPAPAPAPAPAAPPEASTATVSVSSGMDEIHHGLGVGTGVAAVAAAPGKPINVHIHKEAADWEPVSVSVINDTGITENSVSYKPRGKAKALKSGAKCVVRVHPYKGDKMLVVSVYPAAFKKLGTFLELRLLITEGYLEGAKVAAVTIKPGQEAVAYGSQDSFMLEKKGIEFAEDSSEAALKISAINAKPGKGSRNAGSLKGADFGGKYVGTVSFFYGADSVSR